MMCVFYVRGTLLAAHLSLFLWLGIPATTFAIGPIPPMTPGFAGYTAVMLGGAEKKSNLDTKQSATVDNLSQLNTTDGRALGLPAFELNYTLANAETQLYLGTPAERLLNLNFGVEFGLRQRFGGNKIFRLAYLPAVLDSERWSDPYLTGEPRTVTDQSSRGILLGVDHPVFTLNLAQGVVKIDNERSGSALNAAAQNSLRRGGDYFALAINSGFPLKTGVLLLPALIHTEADLNGEAMSHAQTTLNIGLMFKLTNSRLILKVGSGQRRYDADNPVFGRRQRDDLSSASILYLRQNSPLWGEPGLTVLISHRNSDANIDFLDESRSMAAAGLRWSF